MVLAVDNRVKLLTFSSQEKTSVHYKFVRSCEACGVQWVPASGVGIMDIGSQSLSTARYTLILNGLKSSVLSGRHQNREGQDH